MTAERNIVTSFLLAITDFKPDSMCEGKLGYVYCSFQLLHTTTRYSETVTEMKESAFLLSFLFGFCPECDISKK